MNNEQLTKNGFSVIEVILAAAIFVVFATAGATALVSVLNVNRLAQEEAVANQFAQEGLEAVRSIRNQNYSSLVNTSPTTGVIRNGSNVWAFSGTNNTLSTDSRFVRTITVADACRDSTGNLISCGIGVDPNAKKVTSSVSWAFTSARTSSVDLTEYYSNWKASIPASLRGGLIVYGDTTTTPKFRSYTQTTDTFGASTSTIVGSSGLNFIVRTSPTKQEAIAGYTNSSGTLQVMCYNGTSWSNDWSVTVGGTGTTRRFDIAYETSTGNAVVVYSTNAPTTNEMAYRTKVGGSGCGSGNWASAVNITPVRTSGIVHWVKMAWDRRSSSRNIALLWADASASLGAMVWNGSTFVNEPTSALSTTLEFVTAGQDVDSFDLEYESLSGDVMVVWSNTGTNVTGLLKYATCVGGSSACTWSLNNTIPTVADSGTNLDISANPATDEIVMGAIDKGSQDLSIAYWSGSAWTGFANQDTSTATPLAGTKLISTGWVISGATTRYIILYNDSATTNVNGFQSIGVTTPTKQAAWFTPSPVFGNPQKWYDVQMDPFNLNQLMFTLSDTSSKLYAKRLSINSTPTFTWTNSDGSTSLVTGTLGQAISGPFSFAYWRQP